MSAKEVSKTDKPSIQGKGKVIPCGDDWAIVANKAQRAVQAYDTDFIDLHEEGWTYFFAVDHFPVKEPHIHVYKKDE